MAGLEERHHFGEQRADVVRPLAEHAIEVDREVGEIVLERQQADHPVLVDVGLADFEEPAVRAEDRQALGDRLAGQRVEHDVDALAVGVGEDLVGERGRAAAVDVLHAERAEEVALFVAAGRGEDFRAEMLGDLNRGEADAAGTGVNQHPLAGLELREPHQAVVRGEERDRDRAGFVVVDRPRACAPSAYSAVRACDANAYGTTPNTSSPTLNRVTPSPTAVTMPDASMPKGTIASLMPG